MKKYLGEVDVTEELAHERDVVQDALSYIFMYGCIDGAHHKDWVLDQVARILNGAPITVKRASWDNGESELRYSVGESDEYHAWVAKCRDGEDGPETYDYSTGIAP